MPGSSSSSPSSPPAGSAGLSALVDSLREGWRPALLRFAAALIGAALLWIAAAPVWAIGLARVGGLLAPLIEPEPAARYEAEGAHVAVRRTVWVPAQQRSLSLVQPLWTGERQYGPPLLAALILATPGWGWRRRASRLAVGLGLLALTQVAYVWVAAAATLYSPVVGPGGTLAPLRVSPVWGPLWYWVYYFFDIVGRGFFAILIWVAMVGAPARDERARRRAAAGPRNRPCPCGSGLKYKRCCGRR